MRRYRLASQVTMETNPDGGGSLFISHPQRIIKLSPSGVAALRQLCEGSQDLSPAVLEFTVNLENQSIVVREFSPLEDDALPTVTVVIPSYGRPQMLDRCLESLGNLDYPADRLEIIVVDDASPQPINPANLASHVQLLRMNENRGPGAARNLAVQQAKGEIIAFLDDDCLADKYWLRSLVPGLQNPDVGIVGGRVEAADLTNSLGQYEQVMSPLLMGTLKRKVRRGSALSYLPTCNLLIRKTSFLAVGGFDPSLRVGEDVDLCWRVLEKGANIYYLPAGVVYHDHRSRLIPFLKRRYNYGQSEAKLQGKHGQETRLLSLFPGHSYIFAAALIISLLAGSLQGKDAGFFFGLVSLLALGLLNLGAQMLRSLYRIKSAGYRLDSGQVGKAVTRAHISSLYLYSQHFSRYYSIILTILVFPVFPLLGFLFLMVHLWPGVVDYGLKKPTVSPVGFIFYHCLENYFYQAGVFSGCWQERNLRPLVMDIRKVEEAGG